MTLLEEIRNKAGLNEGQLNEGIKFFKASVKMGKIIEKLRKEVKKNPPQNEDERMFVSETFKRLEEIREDARKLEEDFEEARDEEEKKKIKENHKDIENKVKKLLGSFESKKENKYIKDFIGLIFGTGFILISFYSLGILSIIGGFATASALSGFQAKLISIIGGMALGAISFKFGEKTAEHRKIIRQQKSAYMMAQKEGLVSQQVVARVRNVMEEY